MRSQNDYIAFEHAKGTSFENLLRQASDIRDRHWAKVITYSRKIFIPLTTMCRDACGYCVFVQRPGFPTARYMTPDDVSRVAQEGKKMGCKEALFSLGEKPELRYREARDALRTLGYTRTTDYLRDMCERVLQETGLLPHANAGTLSEEEMAMLKPVTGSMGMMLENVSKRLTQKGEAHYACPDKVPAQRIRTLERAGRLHVPFTTGILIGIGETWEERMRSLLTINELHRKYGHIQEVIIQNFRSKPGIPMRDHPEPAMDDMLRTLAVARMILDPSIGLQAPPNLEEHYASYLGAGLNDWGGISPLTIDFINPERAWPHIKALARATEKRGYQLQERLTVYPKYLKNLSTYADPAMVMPIRENARNDGLATIPICDIVKKNHSCP